MCGTHVKDSTKLQLLVSTKAVGGGNDTKSSISQTEEQVSKTTEPEPQQKKSEGKTQTPNFRTSTSGEHYVRRRGPEQATVDKEVLVIPDSTGGGLNYRRLSRDQS